MSILSQIGVVVLIVFIILILMRSNKTLEEVSKEGEHFVDEWDLRQQRKAERLIEKEQKKHGEEYAGESRESDGKGDLGESRESDGEADFEKRWEPYEEDDIRGCQEPIEKIPLEEVQDNRSKKIISMNVYKNAGITLIEMDEQHHPVRQVKVDQLPFYIGRSTKNQLVLDDLCVARMHCRIVEKDGAFLLQDVGSANKLFVNGRVEDQVILKNRLTVYIGNVEFQVEMGVPRSGRTQIYQDAGEYYYE